MVDGTGDRGRSGNLFLNAVDSAIVARWPAALDRARKIDTTRSVDDQAKQVSRAFARELGAIGAATGAVAASPGVGTGTAVALGVGEVSVMITRTADLILTLGAVHGLTNASIEQRRAWVLAVLFFGDTASQGFTRLAGELGKGLGSKATAAIPTKTLQSVNRYLGRTIFTKYGTKRGAIAIGRVLPFGIGMVIGGSANYVLTRTVAGHANAFFFDLPEILRTSDAEPELLTAGSHTVHEAPSAALPSEPVSYLERLDAAVSKRILDTQGAFTCSNGDACAASAAQRSFGFAAGQLSYVGNSYDQRVDGRPHRILIVSMQVGDAEAPVDMARRAAQITAMIDTAQGKRNPHMRGVTRALQILHGLAPDAEHETRDDGTHVLHAFAMANSTLCSALPTAGSSRRGKPTETMLANCSTHLTATIAALEPTIIHSQGADTATSIKAAAAAVVPISDTVSRITIGGRTMVLCALSHPASGPPKSWSSTNPGSYFDITVRPSLALARQTALGLTA